MLLLFFYLPTNDNSNDDNSNYNDNDINQSASISINQLSRTTQSGINNARTNSQIVVTYFFPTDDHDPLSIIHYQSMDQFMIEEAFLDEDTVLYVHVWYVHSKVKLKYNTVLLSYFLP